MLAVFSRAEAERLQFPHTLESQGAEADNNCALNLLSAPYADNDQ
jgi:hypothetical protein